ncbi:MAG: hypothetical protein P1U61_06355 [Legionellaceae bacterium]|nr:hypothetical protein [Legionellaceae bacterium]
MKEQMFIDDLRKVQLTEEPRIIPDMELVWVLSGRTCVISNRYLNEVTKKLDGREFDPNDDYLRVMRGIEVADEINALRAGKAIEDLTDADRVIPLLYNGTVLQNEVFKEALEKNMLPYPKRLFSIESIYPETTVGQIKSFKSFLAENHYRSIALVSSAFHLPRAARTLGEDSPNAWDEEALGLFQNILATIKCYFYGVDKAYRNPGTEIDLKCEPNAMYNYSSGFEGTRPKTISKWVSKNMFLCQEDVEWQEGFEVHQAGQSTSLLSKLPELPMVIPKTCFELTWFGKTKERPEDPLLLLTNGPTL